MTATNIFNDGKWLSKSG